jgi:hypothetical protein
MTRLVARPPGVRRGGLEEYAYRAPPFRRLELDDPNGNRKVGAVRSAHQGVSRQTETQS